MPDLDISLAVFVGLAILTATSGAFFRPGAWYEGLRKPSWRPPNWLFGPVWMVLYGMIAVSGWIVWRSAPAEQVPLAMSIYGAQLILNFLWSYMFFGRRQPGLALAEMSLLWLSIVTNILVFYPVSALAAWLLLPYLLWVSFAWRLNLEMWRLNAPGALRDDAV